MSAAVNPSVLGIPQLNSFFPVDSTEAFRSGFIIGGQDPYWGYREFIYGRYNGSVRQFGLCVMTPALASGRIRYEMTEVPNTANLGRSLAVAMMAGVSGNFGWFCVSGMVPVNCSANIAADTALGITAAGQAGANSAGKQILNARSILPGTTTVVKTCQAPSGTLELQILGGDASGWFAGAYLSGTGIQAGTTVVSVDPSLRIVTLSLATNAAVNSASITATYNNATIHYNVAHINRPFAQGAIT